MTNKNYLKSVEEFEGIIDSVKGKTEEVWTEFERKQWITSKLQESYLAGTEEMRKECLESLPKMHVMLDKDLNSVWTVNEVRRLHNKIIIEMEQAITNIKK